MILSCTSPKLSQVKRWDALKTWFFLGGWKKRLTGTGIKMFCCCMEKIFLMLVGFITRFSLLEHQTNLVYAIYSLFPSCCSHISPTHDLGSMVRAWEGFRASSEGRGTSDSGSLPWWTFSISRGKGRMVLGPWGFSGIGLVPLPELPALCNETVSPGGLSGRWIKPCLPGLNNEEQQS